MLERLSHLTISLRCISSLYLSPLPYFFFDNKPVDQFRSCDTPFYILYVYPSSMSGVNRPTTKKGRCDSRPQGKREDSRKLKGVGLYYQPLKISVVIGVLADISKTNQYILVRA